MFPDRVRVKESSKRPPMVSSQRVSMPTTGNCRSLLALVALVGLREADCAAVRKTCREARQNLHNVHAVVNDHTWCYQIPTQVPPTVMSGRGCEMRDPDGAGGA